MHTALQRASDHLSRLRAAAVARLPWLRHVGWAEVILLACAAVAWFVAELFVELADDVQEGVAAAPSAARARAAKEHRS
jgi:hypothetical protein